jgi:adenosylmethionine-8-amino-7-oxononanoate aminotransferase
MSKLIFPYATNDVVNVRQITEYTKFGFKQGTHELLDLSLGNCGCFPLGFKEQDIIDEVTEQMSKLPFCSGEFYTTNQAVLELGDKLYDLSGGYRSVFALSGSDAIEGAIRLAQLYNRRNKFLGFTRSYHGSTYMSSSVSDATYMTDFYGKDPRCIISDYNLDSITDELCAVVIETSSWQNGLYDPGQDFWKGLRQKCTDLDVVLIVDDIAMCGGKTGSFFGWSDTVRPDIFTMGKSFTGGYFPLSATLIDDKIYDAIKDIPFAHGFSYSFSLSGIYSTLAYIRKLEKEKLLESVNDKKKLADNIFNHMQAQGIIKSYNSFGLVYNLELVTEKSLTSSFEQFLYQYGISAGMWNEGGSGLLIVVPINADDEYFEFLNSRLTQALIDYRATATVSD